MFLTVSKHIKKGQIMSTLKNDIKICENSFFEK